MDSSDANKIRKLIAQAEELIAKSVTASSPEFKAWNISVQRMLNKLYGEDSYEANIFKREHFSLSFFTTSTPEYEWVKACQSGLQSTVGILQTYLEDEVIEQASSEAMPKNSIGDRASVFVVHGHDGELRESVARLLEKQNIRPVVLMEQVNAGQTIIEKFEQHSAVGAAVCLFTGDDLIESGVRRPRQNVVFEAGFFIGRLGRERVIVLSDGNVDMPSDLNGVMYINTANWEIDVLRELAQMGYDIDLNAML